MVYKMKQKNKECYCAENFSLGYGICGFCLIQKIRLYEKTKKQIAKEIFDDCKLRMCQAPEVCEIENNFICNNCKQINWLKKKYGVENE